MCAGCGANFGEEIDKAVVKHCINFSTLLNVKRDRGVNQDIILVKKSGEEIFLSAHGEIKPKIKGKPTIHLKKNGKPDKIIARSVQELNMYKGILKKDYPDFAYDIKEEDVYEEDILNIPYSISQDTLRGICKIAVEFFLEKGGLKEEIIHLIPYLGKEKDDSQRPVHVFYPSNSFDTDSDVFHLIHIKGIKEHKMLFAYIKLFGVSGFFIALNWGNYNGDDIEYNYLFDLLESEEKTIDFIDFNYSEVNTFLGEVQSDFKDGKDYIVRDDMNNIFMDNVHLFESFIETLRKDIKFKKTDIEKKNVL
jgi:hypothetical protein